MINIGDVIQINNKGPDGWEGCLTIVVELKGWGVIAYAERPNEEPLYVTLRNDSYDFIGEAVLVRRDALNKEVKHDV